MTDTQAITFLNWIQLCDSAFPSGRFVHSNGLEAWLAGNPGARERDIATVAQAYVSESVTTLDAVALAWAWTHDHLDDSLVLDRALSAHKLSESGRLSSTACGRQLALVAQRVLSPTSSSDYLTHVLASQAPGNQAVVEGIVHRRLGIDRHLAVLGFVRSSYSGLLSAAVRLGRAGPMWVQQQLFDDRYFLETCAERAIRTDWDDAMAFAPELDIYAMQHETNSSRLFTT
ncbi:urease accessory protein UreF [Rhodococcoides kyotonense]|uniref:Urease accessory protein UreF n=1 Tax=Rhodococcoides kyotonense TaxID=398843 RepID=A0A239LH99_9NOCA|nr:urease accessory UreF family protein [Rhodococcus kyotonensis]SNT29670.1 urease accessory protein [Rhodococcus kyotonensis]